MKVDWSGTIVPIWYIACWPVCIGTPPAIYRQSFNSLLIKAHELARRRPVRNRKLWINRQRQQRNEIRRWVTVMEQQPRF